MGGSDEAIEAATTMQTDTTKTEVVLVPPQQEVPASSAQKSMEHKAERKRSMRARYIYGIVFLISNLCAWIVRDYGQLAQPQFHCTCT